MNEEFSQTTCYWLFSKTFPIPGYWELKEQISMDEPAHYLKEQEYKLQEEIKVP